MSDKNLLIGDTTYPHLAQSTNENICAQLRELAPDLVKHHTKQIVFAIDRIEQLERELAEVQKDSDSSHRMFMSACDDLGAISDELNINSDTDGGAEPILEAIEELRDQLAKSKKNDARYEYVRKLNVIQFSNVCITNICDGIPFDDLIDAAIREGKA